MILFISLVLRVLCSANFLISSATTAKPRPASPALAASIAAFRANRFVCSAISSIATTILPIFADLVSRAAISSAIFLVLAVLSLFVEANSSVTLTPSLFKAAIAKLSSCIFSTNLTVLLTFCPTSYKALLVNSTSLALSLMPAATCSIEIDTCSALAKTSWLIVLNELAALSNLAPVVATCCKRSLSVITRVLKESARTPSSSFLLISVVSKYP